MADGYGLSEGNVRKLAERGTELIVTVDCGITAVAEVALARELGIETIVTDHHQAGDELPDCLILHPALDGYPFAELCGTAVAWKLACALREAVGAGSPKRSAGASLECFGDPTPTAASDATDLDLVALATVADVVPLVGENRALVRRGLEEVRRARRPGMRALLAAAKCDPSQLDEGDLAFRLGPRINAAGRLYRADAGVELFLTEDEERAEEIAAELGRANSERRATEREVANEAEAALRELPDRLREAHGLVVAGEGWHPGVIGIVASRLVEKHHRPVVVISLDGEGGGRGSGRSIPGFDLLAGLEACSEHLGQFGGHKAAAGLELEAGDVEAFREAFAAHANAVLAPEDLKRTERVDAIVGGASLGLDLAEELRQLAPFGMGNPGVRLLVPSARVRDVRDDGGRGEARSVQPPQRGASGAGGRLRAVEPWGGGGRPVDVAVRLEVNRWNGAVEPRVVLRELYPREAERGVSVRRRSGGGDSRPRLSGTRPGRPLRLTPRGGHRSQREVLTSGNAPAAVVGELASSGESVLALCADAGLRAGMDATGCGWPTTRSSNATPTLPVNSFMWCWSIRRLRLSSTRLAGRPCEEGGYLHRVWGEAEWRLVARLLGGAVAAARGADRAPSATCATPARQAVRSCGRRCWAAGPARAAPRPRRAVSGC